MKYKCGVCHEVFDYLPEICPICGADNKAFWEFKEEIVSYRKDTNEKFVIIGGGIAALETAKAIRARNKTASIKMIFSEDKLPYKRPALSDFICGDMLFSDIVIENYNFYKNNNIELYKNKTALKIDTKQKVVLLDDDSLIEYDKLCLACGSHSFCPFELKEDQLPIKTLRSYKDAMDILSLIDKGKKVVIAGGGILGIEAAMSLNQKGLDVTVLERGECVVKAQLDRKSSDLLRQALENKGIRVLLNSTVKEIKKDSVVLDNGMTLFPDFMIVSMGVRANTSLALDADIQVGKAIVVDDYMRSSDPYVYCAGDCAEYKGKPGGLWIISSAQGKCAGANMTGEMIKYSVVPFATAFSGLGVTFFSAGNVHSGDTKTFSDKNSYKLLSFEDDKLIGGILWQDTRNSSKLMKLLSLSADKETAVEKLLNS